MTTTSTPIDFLIGDTKPVAPSAGKGALYVRASSLPATSGNSTAYIELPDGTEFPLTGGVTSVTAADTSVTITPNVGAVTVSRAALTGAITAPAGNNTTSLGSFTSAQLAAATTDETGSAGGGLAVYNNSPTLISPILTGVSGPTYTLGKLVFDNDNDCLTFYNSDSNVSLQIGQEFWIRVKNVSGSTINNGQAVYINGGSTTFPTIALAKADAVSTSLAVGITTESIANNGTGFVTCGGLIHGLDTSAFSVGDSIYVSATTAGALTKTAPTPPNYPQRIAQVIVSNASTGIILLNPTENGTGTFGAYVYQNAATIKPKDVMGRVFVDTANTSGWAGSDAGAWINSAYSYIHTTYGDNNGGVIELAPGSYSFSTPIVLANAGLMSCVLRGAGDGNGSTILNYTSASGIALSVGGGSGNDGGIQLEDFTVTGTAQGNGATAIQFGVTGVANIAGATCKNISIRRFTNGFAHLNGNSYAVTFINCKVQQTTNGYTPQGENNNWHGGLLGGNATGLLASNACEYQMFGTAFDDNTTTGINSSNSLARGTLDGCRFENAGGGTDTYITMSAGSITQHGGGMQNDILGAGASTGFVQQTGGVYNCLGTWLESAAGSARTYTQIFNVSGTSSVAHIDPIISPVGTITGTTQLVTPGFAAKRIDWLRLNNQSTAVQSIAALGAAPGTYLTNSNINVPTSAIVGVAVGTCFEWTFTIAKSAVGTGNFSFIFYVGTNGSTADTAAVTVNLTQTAALDNAFITATLVCATAGATGTLTGAISGVNKAATAAGFGFVSGTSGPAAVTSGAINLTTAGLKFGMALASATGTPAVTVSNVKARVYNLD